MLIFNLLNFERFLGHEASGIRTCTAAVRNKNARKLIIAMLKNAKRELRSLRFYEHCCYRCHTIPIQIDTQERACDIPESRSLTQRK